MGSATKSSKLKKSHENLLIRTYVANIQGRGGGSGDKLAELAVRTDDKDFIVLNETNCRKGSENSIALNCRAIAITDGGESDKMRGFGTSVASKVFNPDTDKIIECNDKCEISAISRKISSEAYMTVIGVYLSPNASNEKVSCFWTELERVLKSRVDAADKIILIGGDPNACIGTPRFNRLERLREKYHGFRVISSPTRGKNQPDHVLAFYDPTLFTVDGVVVDGVGDHNAMEIEVSSTVIKSLREVWSKKRIVVDTGNPDVIAEQLQYQLSNFNPKRFEGLSLLPSDIDKLTVIFAESVAEVRERNFTYKSIVLPEHKNKRIKCKLLREAQFCLNRVWTATKKLAGKPGNQGLRENLVKKKSAYAAACRIAAKSSILKNISKMRKFSKVNTSRFFKMTGMHLRFDGIAAIDSREDIDKKLDAAELNYHHTGEMFDPDELVGLFQGIRKFDINTNPEFICKRIKKLTKVDDFFKKHANILAGPLSVLLAQIKKIEYFPASCKIARLALLPTRTIFFLEFLPKLLEDIIDAAVEDVMPPECEGQMAYIKNRSGNLCVAIGLDAAERSDENVLNIEWDQTKAFDSTNWGATCRAYEEKAGLGRFIWDYLQNRTYKYVYDITGNSRTGFQDVPMGRGTWPGTLLGPRIFSIFQGTNTVMNKSNPVWLWPGKFSDDCSPVAKWSRYIDGSIQNQLDGIWKWKNDMSIGIHIQGKKRPFYYVFRKRNITTASCDAILDLGGHKIDRSYSKRQLGINMHFYRDDQEPNDYGYFLEWQGKAPLSNLAYRLQDMKYVWDTEFLRTCVQSYVVGKLQFAASLYWLRATNASIRRARFDYCMALASVVGCNVAEIVGMMNCKTRGIGETCQNYQKLCRFLNLPTMHDMAVKDARNMIRQWFIYDSSRFVAVPRNSGVPIANSVDVHIAGFIFDITGISEIDNAFGGAKTLISDLFKLSIEKSNDFYPGYRSAKKSGSLTQMDDSSLQSILPEWQRDYKSATDETRKLYKQLGKKDPDDRSIMNTFWLMCRDRFKVLERYHRVVKHLERTPVPQRFSTVEKRTSDGPKTPVAKRQRHFVIECKSSAPLRRAKLIEGKMTCWICGYSIKQKKLIEFECCDTGKVSHNLCWKNQSDGNTPIMCCNVKHYYKSGSRIPDKNVVFNREPVKSLKMSKPRIDKMRDEMYCSSCDKMVDLNDPSEKDHLKYTCPGIPSTPLKPDFSRNQLARRMAALGARKKLHNHNFSPHKPTEPTQ